MQTAVSRPDIDAIRRSAGPEAAQLAQRLCSETRGEVMSHHHELV